MKQKIVLIFVLFTLMSAGGAFAVEQYYLSHVANGITGSSSFRTTFVLFNNFDSDLTVSLKLTGDSGTPLPVAIGGMGTHSEFSIYLSAGSAQILQTDGSGALATGAATVSSPSPIGVSAIFGIYDAADSFIAEAGVGGTTPMTDFVAPVDTTGLFNTGLALFNPGSGTATIAAVLRDTNGRTVDQATLSLGANAHVARFVAGAGQLFPSLGGFRGTLWMHCSAPVSALVLRQNQEPLSYTSLPVVPSASARTTMNLPQVVSGAFDKGSYQTSFLLFNLSSGVANVTLSLTDDHGDPLAVTIPGSGTRSSFALSLPAAGSTFLQTDSSGPLTAGAATITSTAAIGAAGIFTVFDAKGAFQTEAGVGDSPVMAALTLPVDIAPSFETGVAFFNPAGTAATISLKLLDSSGALFDPGASIDLGARSHAAKFVSQLFPGTGNFRGSLAILAPAGVAALTLRQNTSPLSYTTLPVVAGTSSGKPPQPLLLSATQSGIDATADLTIDKTLTYGLRLAGHIAGAARIIDVVAQRADGKTYSGVADPDTSRSDHC